MPGKSARNLTVEEVRARFEHWRQNRQGKAAIPDDLWSAAIEVARRNGVNRTAAELHLDGGKLKRLMVGAGPAPEKDTPPSFVELIAPEAAVVPECSVELEGRRGKLRIQLKGTTAADLAALSRMLWDLAS
jgi:hypothetical protein